MRQTHAFVIGAVCGLGVAIAFAPLPGALDTFVCAASGSWAGGGLFGLIFGEVTLAGRGGKSPKTYTGLPARAIGFGMLALIAGFLYSMARLGT